MKTRINPFMILAAFGASVFQASAADRYWAGASTDNTAATLWSTTNNIWGDATGEGGTAGTPDTQAFAASDNAIFEGTAATVQLGSAISAGTITLNGYTVNLDNNTTTNATGFNLSATDIIGNGVITNSDTTARTFTWAPTVDYTGTLSVTRSGSGITNLTFNAANSSVVGLVTYGGNQTSQSTLNVTQGILRLNGSTGTSVGINATIGANGTLDLNGKTFAYRTLSSTGLITNSSSTAATLQARPASSNFGGLITGKINITTSDLSSNTFSGAISNGDLNLTSTAGTSSTSANSNYIFSNATLLGTMSLGKEATAGSTGSNRSFNMAFVNADSAVVGNVAIDGSVTTAATGSSNGQNNTAFVLGGSNATVGNVTFTSNAKSVTLTTGTYTSAQGYSWLRLAGSNATAGNITMNGSYTQAAGGFANQLATSRVEVMGSTAQIGNLVASTANPTNINKLVILGGVGVNATPDDGSTTTLTINTTADSSFSGVITDATVTAANATLSGVTSNFVSQGSAAIDSLAVGNLIKIGDFTQILAGANTYTGTTKITAGNLRVNGSLAAASAVTVDSTGTLSGTGTVNGTVNASGVIAPGVAIGTLTVGATTLNSTTALNYDLDGDVTTIGGGVNDLLTVNGALTLDGTLNVTESVAGTFAASAVAGDSYRLIDFSGAITNNGLILGTMPALPLGLKFAITTSTNEVNLVVQNIGGGGNTYADWLTANSPATGFVTDSDKDGVPNGVENVLGTNPNTYSAGLTQVSATATSVTYQHTLNPTVASDVTPSYEWSTDLVEWKASGQPNTGGVNATIVPSAPVSGVVTVVTTVTVGSTPKLFTRLVAVQ